MFVNKRYIKNKAINVAVENAFKSFNVTNKFPFYIMFIEIYPELIDVDPANIDVNIHPTKSEIRFKDERFVFKTVFDAIHTALRKSIEGEFNIEEEETPFKINKFEVNQLSLDSEIDKLNSLKEIISKSNYEKTSKQPNDLSYYNSVKKDDYFSAEQDLEKNIENSNIIKENLENVILSDNALEEYSPISLYATNKDKENIIYDIKSRDSYELKESKQDKIFTKKAKFPKLKVIGQFNKTYILAEYADILYIIDQHAAHEKVYFDFTRIVFCFNLKSLC